VSVNEPPRYQPSRAFPERAYVPGPSQPGKLPPRVRPGRGPNHDAAFLPAAKWFQNVEYLWGVDLYNAGFFWEAHEAWEGVWRAAAEEPDQHRFLQALIQCAAACLKAHMGNPEAARRLAARALRRLDDLRAGHLALYMGVDLSAFVTDFRRFIVDPAPRARAPWLLLDCRFDSHQPIS
jgi:hypothetical protein